VAGDEGGDSIVDYTLVVKSVDVAPQVLKREACKSSQGEKVRCHRSHSVRPRDPEAHKQKQDSEEGRIRRKAGGN